jgi:hypothetical protein
MRGLRGLAQCSRSRRHDFIGNDLWIVSTAHACIQMNLGESCFDVQPHHLHSLLHRSVCIQMLPGIRPKVVTSQNQAPFIEAQFAGNRIDIVAKHGRSQTCISTCLVHLIAGRFQQKVRAIVLRVNHGSFDDPGMCGAHRVDAPLTP